MMAAVCNYEDVKTFAILPPICPLFQPLVSTSVLCLGLPLMTQQTHLVGEASVATPKWTLERSVTREDTCSGTKGSLIGGALPGQEEASMGLTGATAAPVAVAMITVN